eukprot:c27189_g1_i1 orf=2-169(-)
MTMLLRKFRDCRLRHHELPEGRRRIPIFYREKQKEKGPPLHKVKCLQLLAEGNSLV